MTSHGDDLLVILPMRGGSERVPGKNLALLAGRPLYSWILDTALTLGAAQVVVDTDDDAIAASVARTHPGITVLRRPAELGRGETPMNDVLLNTLSQMPDGRLILQVHATNPFVLAASLSAAVDAIAPGSDSDAAFSVTRIQARLWSSAVEPLNHDPARLLPTQQLDPILIENSSFYAFRREAFLSTGNRLGLAPTPIAISPVEAVDIDTPDDWEFADVVATGLLAKAGAAP